jgi:hypothetical protein
MFLVEGYAGLLADSTSQLAEALDMLGGALLYGFRPLFVLVRSPRAGRRALLPRGWLPARLSARRYPGGRPQGLPRRHARTGTMVSIGGRRMLDWGVDAGRPPCEAATHRSDSCTFV